MTFTPFQLIFWHIWVWLSLCGATNNDYLCCNFTFQSYSQSRGLQAHIFPTSQQVPWGTDWLGPGQTFEHLDVMSRLRKKNNEWYAYSSWWQSTTLKRVLPKFYQHAQILPRQRNTLDHVNRNISIYRIYKYPTDKKKDAAIQENHINLEKYTSSAGVLMM